MKKFACLLILSLIASFFNYSFGQSLSNAIITDQFGYLPDQGKIAIIKDPKVGFDVGQSFTPGSQYALVDSKTGQQVFQGAPVPWKSGATDTSSGDKIWHFDFSSINRTGKYFVLDIERNLRSFEFEISPSAYNEVLKQAVRTFFYQRAGFPKEAKYAGTGWADGASHSGNLQDKNCRIFNDKNNAATERDVSGGWFDAGDYNKYTSWTANYVIEMMKAYLEKPSVWADNYNIPESGNGIPDLLDEAKWGIDHLLRMQLDNGSVLSIVGLSHASPPSKATGPSYYGSPSTFATLNTSAAFAIASKVFRIIGNTVYADLLQARALSAWNWAVSNPAVIFKNNDSANGSSGLGAGQQETDDYGRLMSKLKAACYLFDITGDAAYRSFFDTNYTQVHLLTWTFAYPFETENQDILLYYAALPNSTASVKSNIKTVYKNAMVSGSENLPAISTLKDPYFAHLKDYTWGSNSIKALQGNMYYGIISYSIDEKLNTEARQAALHFIHYLHGRNPLNIIYLSNMYKYGGENCVNEFYHTWFTNGSAKWDRVGKSTYGPPPGFLTGGPNPSYNWDGCCPSGCGSTANNALCLSESIVPPKNQPVQKSYKDFNTSWPLNSWSVTENSCGYQINYIRLLSKFADITFDCNGDKNGSAFLDACAVCAGGNTGRVPVVNADNCLTSAIVIEKPNDLHLIDIFPNPTSKILYFTAADNVKYFLKIINSSGKVIYQGDLVGSASVDMGIFAPGLYMVFVQHGTEVTTRKVVKI